MSGFSMSPPAARAGPRDENDATSGATTTPAVRTPADSCAVGFAVIET